MFSLLGVEEDPAHARLDARKLANLLYRDTRKQQFDKQDRLHQSIAAANKTYKLQNPKLSIQLGPESKMLYEHLKQVWPCFCRFVS